MTRPADFVFTGSVTDVPRLEPVYEGVMISREVFPNGVKTSDVPWTFEITLAPSGGSMTKKTKVIDLEINWMTDDERVVHTTRYPLPVGDKLMMEPYPELIGVEIKNGQGVVIPMSPEMRADIEQAYRDNIAWIQIVVRGVRDEVVE